MNGITPLHRWLRRGQHAAFVYLSALLMVVASERVYWYWGGVTFDSVVGLTAIYSLAAAAALWSLALTRATSVHHVILAGAVFGFIVEGVITPVIYFDGPFPVFAAMFVGWHGVVGLFGFWYLVRRWLLAGRLRLIAMSATAAGLAWGVWARAAAVAETLDATELATLAREGIDASILSPGAFGGYAITVTAIFAAGHWLVGHVWPRSWTPGRGSTYAVGLLNAGYMALAVLPVFLWAPLKLAPLLAVTLWLMRRHQDEGRPTILEQLHGRVPWAWVLAIMPLGAFASLSYWLIDAQVSSVEALSGIYWAAVTIQVGGGAAAYVWAARRALRRRAQPRAFAVQEPGTP